LATSHRQLRSCVFTGPLPGPGRRNGRAPNLRWKKCSFSAPQDRWAVGSWKRVRTCIRPRHETCSR
jgi:hypothetical protein